METEGSVLIVDDELGARESMQRILNGRFSVSTVDSGTKAIEIVKERNFDVVVLDIVLQDITGIQALERIKQIEPSPEVMMVTANAAVNTAKDAMRLGAYDYIEKPFKINEFREAVSRGIERRLKASKTEQLLMHLEKLSSIGQMSSEILHELATPITGVIGYSEFLLAQQSDGIIKDSLRKINAEAERCQTIIRNILSFARKSESDKHYININDAILKTIEIKVYQLKLDGIELELNLDPELPKTTANFGEIQQVVVNIVNNAHYSMKNHYGERILSINTSFDSKDIYVKIRNTGPTIPEDKLDLIFEPYFTTKQPGNGTGLGLSICRRILHEHNGEIYVDSNEGGVTFILEIPIVIMSMLQ